ncbi:Hypothetical protein NGAL_HAMBI2427_21710 [Neorhizobium galegae bv. orientalis]|nr:Hypothetical protein NGAL_HAMBI2427_21710 [Neorhizobium galegae bv. orientalis]
MTRMHVAAHGLAKIGNGPPHARILYKEFEAMRQFINVVLRLQHSKCLNPIANDIDNF